ncbi:MAG: DUF1080 domain-containing protein [Planctomycetes bacterium]|nr:DUF1080 domain-containing protein [Planctomycetota bacterium]
MTRVALMFALFSLFSAAAVHAAEKSQSLFNGKNLKGWEGDPAVWSVEDGAIIGRTTDDMPIKNNTFLIWNDGKLGDFRLRLEYKIEGGNSGVQYRSKVIEPAQWIVGGYQADIDSTPTYSGINYDERGRGILANRGERVRINREGKLETESIGDAAELQKSIHSDDWNEYLVEAIGPRMRHTINGKLMSVTVDRDTEKAVKEGVLALQVHAGPPMTVRFRNIRLEKVDAKAEADERQAKQTGKPKAKAKAQ